MGGDRLELMVKLSLSLLFSSLFVFLLFPVVLFLAVWGAAFVAAYAVVDAVWEKVSGRKWKWK